jgi:hypothetical protein
MASACPHTASPPPALEPRNPKAPPYKKLTADHYLILPPPWGFSPQSIRHCTKNQRGRSGRRRKGGDQDRRPGAEPLGSRRGEAHIEDFSSDHSYSASSSTSIRGSAAVAGTPRSRSCCTRKMSLWKPWTAPLYFPCSRPFHAARSTTSSSRPEREVSTEALSCCGARPSSRGRVRAL